MNRNYSVLKKLKYVLPISKNKYQFVRKLKAGALVLDVGCGNYSPERLKIANPTIRYIGIDVGDYCNDTTSLANADSYIVCRPEIFSDTIHNLPEQFDGVISTQNLEHCNNPIKTLDAMCERLACNGQLFLTFPSERSAHFPSRKGTLCFYDDATHQWLPQYDDIIARLKQNRLTIVFARRQYHPPFLFLLGLLLEPLSRLLHTVFPGTWALWGFESVIWAKREQGG